MKQKFISLGFNILPYVEALSTCSKTHVGAILFRDDRIIAIGYNGTPTNWEHCCDNPELHLTYDVHAEANIIAFCAKNGIVTEDTILFTNITPCTECAKLIVQAGIKEVYCREMYHRDQIGYNILLQSNILVHFMGD
jgi:dCMP deaminase